MVRIVFLDRGTIGPSVELTKPAFAHEWIEHAQSPHDEVVQRLAGARIAITQQGADPRPSTCSSCPT